MTDSTNSSGMSTDIVLVVDVRTGHDNRLDVELGAEMGIDFSGGPPGVTVTVEHMVLKSTVALKFSSGRLRLLPQVQAHPPTGARVSLDLGGVTAGGYLRHRNEPPIDEWLGAIAADLGPVEVTGLFIIGRVDRIPSFLAVLGARFAPGIQIGFGFEVTGVGGLIGVNRTANTDLMRERLAGGAVGNVLFCEDPVKNAPTILDDLSHFFPSAQGRVIVGPTFQLSWIKPIIRADAGILIELPGPAKIIIIGSLRVLIGANENAALLFLRMDFVGEVDLQRQLVSLDAQLVNSHALQIFRLTGGMALRMYYGPDPYVLLTIGGFHPRFDPGPLTLPAVPRVGAAPEAPVGALLRLEMYTAFTPNTLQAGAHVQAGMRLGPLSADGYFDFDTLITFKPFTFDVEFAAGFAVRVFGRSLASVDVSGRLTGPGPLVIHARASVKILLVRVCGSATFTLGSRNGDSVTAIPSVIDAIAGELPKPENLVASGGDRAVRLRTDVARPANRALLYPSGTLKWTQRRVPLGVDIQRLENAPLAGTGHRLSVVPVPGTPAPVFESAREWFSPASFSSCDSSELMNNAGFEQLPGGITFTAPAVATSGDARDSNLNIRVVKLPRKLLIPGGTFRGYGVPGLVEALWESTFTPAVAARDRAVRVSIETFVVLAPGGVVSATEDSSVQARLCSQRSGGVAIAASDVAVAL